LKSFFNVDGIVYSLPELLSGVRCTFVAVLETVRDKD
jgi:hypothetical protein